MHLILTHSEPNGRTTGKVSGTLEISECDECGAAVSDPDLHTEWHKGLSAKPTAYGRVLI